jgi:hypothetical protein
MTLVFNCWNEIASIQLAIIQLQLQHLQLKTAGNVIYLLENTLIHRDAEEHSTTPWVFIFHEIYHAYFLHCHLHSSIDALSRTPASHSVEYMDALYGR